MARLGRGRPAQPRFPLHIPYNPDAKAEPSSVATAVTSKPVGTTTRSGTSAVTGGLAGTPSGVKHATGSARIHLAFRVNPNGTTGAPASTATGLTVTPTGVKHATGSARISLGARLTPNGHKAAASNAKIRAGITLNPTGVHAGAGSTRVTAGWETSGTGTAARTGSALTPAAFTMNPAAVGDIQITNTWTASYTAPTDTTDATVAADAPPPLAVSVPVTVSNTSGRWLFAVVAWRQAPGYPDTEFHISDDAHNWWDPQGAPAATSPGGSTLRVAVWRAPTANAATLVTAAPTGFVLSAVVTIIEVDAMLPWVTEAGTVTAFASASTSLPALTPSPPPGPVVWISAVARGLNSAPTSLPSGWQPGPVASASSGADTAADLTLVTAFRQATGTPTVTWSSGATATDMAGVMTGVLVFGVKPVTLNPAWPPMSLEIAPGAGALTPASEIHWVPVDSGPITRLLDFSFTQGQQYEIGSTEAGSGAMIIGNQDLAVVPPGLNEWAGIDSGTPWRLRIAWPGGGKYPVNPTPWYILRGFFLSLPATWSPTTRYGTVNASITDAWAFVQSRMRSTLQHEILGDAPTHYWTLTDPVGTTYASNAAHGSNAALLQIASRYGASTATAAFGSSTTVLTGDSGSVWEQGNLPAAATKAGFCLYCHDPAFPALNHPNGVTFEGSFSLPGPMYQTGTLWVIKSTKGPIMRLEAATNGTLTLRTWETNGTQVATSLGSASYLGAGLFHTVVKWKATTGWKAYVNGKLVKSSTTAPNLAPSFAWISVAGESDRFASGGSFNGIAAHMTIYGHALPDARITGHYYAGFYAHKGEFVFNRHERILGYAGWTGPRHVKRHKKKRDKAASAKDFTQKQAGQALADLVNSASPAMIYVAPGGEIVYQDKNTSFGETPKWVLGEDTAAGEIPYLGDIWWDWDPQRVINDIQITHLDSGAILTPEVLTALLGGKKKYGSIPYQITGYLHNSLSSPVSDKYPSNLVDLANWLSLTLNTPHLRVVQVTVDAASYPQAWPLVLGVSPGDMATVHRRPITAERTLTATARITRVQRTLTWKEGQATGKVVLTLDNTPEAAPLVFDDPDHGQLDGTRVLAW